MNLPSIRINGGLYPSHRQVLGDLKEKKRELRDVTRVIRSEVSSFGQFRDLFYNKGVDLRVLLERQLEIMQFMTEALKQMRGDYGSSREQLIAYVEGRSSNIEKLLELEKEEERIVDAEDEDGEKNFDGRDLTSKVRRQRNLRRKALVRNEREMSGVVRKFRVNNSTQYIREADFLLEKTTNCENKLALVAEVFEDETEHLQATYLAYVNFIEGGRKGRVIRMMKRQLGDTMVKVYDAVDRGVNEIDMLFRESRFPRIFNRKTLSDYL